MKAIRQLLLLALIAPSLGAMEATVSPPSVTVGDHVVVLLDVPFATDGSIPLLPDTFETWGTAEVVNAERITALVTDAPTGEAEGGGSEAPTSVRYRIELRSFRTGRIDLPPLSLQAAPNVVEANQASPSDPGSPTQNAPEAPATEPFLWTTPDGLGFDVTS
ncbi:MAG: hypothetical protein K8J08_06165, partial [Thermoanaerobaculia bacterium]|nr:hypothetical protein [Thermoanaerobaculia bacterium]